MLRQIEQIPYIKDLVKRLRRTPYIRKTCGYGDKAPCEAHFSQMKKRIGVEGFRIIEAWLRREGVLVIEEHGRMGKKTIYRMTEEALEALRRLEEA